MMKKALPFNALILTFLIAHSSAAFATPQHFFWADDVASNIQPENNLYDSNPSYVTWPDANGVGDYTNRSKCSSFVTIVLMKSYGWTTTDFKKWMASTSPTADKYYNAIETQNRFSKIRTVSEIQPGDFIAIKYPSTSTSTGHLMMVRSVPVLRTPTSPLVPDTNQYEVQIIDSSQSGHGPADTRKMPDGTWDDGVGIGTARLYTNSSDEIVGYTWSTYNSSVFYSTQTNPVAVGRLF